MEKYYESVDKLHFDLIYTYLMSALKQLRVSVFVIKCLGTSKQSLFREVLLRDGVLLHNIFYSFT